MADDDLIRLSATEVVEALTTGAVSPAELIDAAADRIEAVDGAVNALPTLCLDRARDRAAALEGAAVPEDRRGWLAGLPVVIKDLVDVAGVRTTYGSPLFANHVPARSDILVERLEERGALVTAKSNTPEFGAGANTFNEVFGETRNPWNTALTCGGSSGGSAVALATGMAWLASGSDLGGSLRTPASFCGVVGLRPSPGRVARAPTTDPFDTLSVEGSMARSVPDIALMLDAMAGSHPEDPLSRAAPAQSYVGALAGEPPARIGWSLNLGFLPVEPEVAAVCEKSLAAFAAMGAAVDDTCPDFSDAGETFQVLRAADFATAHAEKLVAKREMLKPDIIWNVEKGLALSADEIGKARRARAALYGRMADFFETHDLLAAPAALVPPFDVNERYVARIGDVEFDNYMDWLGITFAITLTGCPAISVPCGFTDAGLPVGLQLVGPPHGEAAVLAAAARFEEALGLNRQLPIDPRRLG